MNFRRLSLLMLAAGVWLTLTVTTAQAAGVVGNGTPGSCKFKALKRAVAEGGTVTFNCGSAPVTINTKATLMIDEDTVIDGGGKVTLDAGGKHRIMLVRNSKTLTVRGLTFRSGYADHRIDKAADEAGQDIRSDGNGGAINVRWRGNLNIENSTFIGNKAVVANPDSGGGAVRFHESLVTIRDSKFVNNVTEGKNGSGGAVFSMLSNVEITDTVMKKNRAVGSGGAFYNDGTLRLTDDGYIRFDGVQFIKNTGGGQGGGAFVFLYVENDPGIGTATISNSIFKGNQVVLRYENGEERDALGGGLRVGNGPVTISSTLFLKNKAVQQGGGLWTGEVATVDLINSTFSRNTADLGGGMTIASQNAVDIVNSTFAENTADFMGGAIFGGEEAEVTLRNNLIVANRANNPWNINHQCAETYNGSASTIQFPRKATDDQNDHDCAGNLTHTDPGLKPLKKMGKTSVYKIGKNSAAVGIGENCPEADQRGKPRPASGCDAGAFEAKGGAAAAVTGFGF